MPKPSLATDLERRKRQARCKRLKKQLSEEARIVVENATLAHDRYARRRLPYLTTPVSTTPLAARIVLLRREINRLTATLHLLEADAALAPPLPQS